MARAALTEQQRETTRRQIAEVALRLFAEQGYEGVTLRALAAELGVSAMTPYRYFADKDEIVLAVRELAYQRYADAAEAAVDGVVGARERLLALGRGLVRFALDEPHAYRHLFALNQPGHAPPLGSVLEGGRAWSLLLGVVADAVAAGGLAGDVDTLAHLVWAPLHGLVSLHLAHKLVVGRSLGDLLEPLLAALLRAHAPPGAA